MEITPAMQFEVLSRYPMYFRQAMRFIAIIGGPQALDRFEEIMSGLFNDVGDDELDEVEKAAKAFVRDSVRRDLVWVREEPDMVPKT